MRACDGRETRRCGYAHSLVLQVIDRLGRVGEFALTAISNNFFPKCRHYANCAADLEVPLSCSADVWQRCEAALR